MAMENWDKTIRDHKPRNKAKQLFRQQGRKEYT